MTMPGRACRVCLDGQRDWLRQTHLRNCPHGQFYCAGQKISIYAWLIPISCPCYKSINPSGGMKSSRRERLYQFSYVCWIRCDPPVNSAGNCPLVVDELPSEDRSV